MNFSSGKQFVKPPQRGIFPLDHDAECKPKMQVSSMVVWRCIPVREKDDVNLEIEKFFCGVLVDGSELGL